VTVVGYVGRLEGADLAHAYAALDVFVHTGTRETFGQTLQEAAATGLPVVAPARGAPPSGTGRGRRWSTSCWVTTRPPGTARRRGRPAVPPER
jgi:phosphatidylinositol alpha 1,6-mannosyltransferase